MVYVNEKGNLIIESKGTKDFEDWLSIRKAIIESLQAQNSDFDSENNYYLLELLLDLELTLDQAKALFKTKTIIK